MQDSTLWGPLLQLPQVVKDLGLTSQLTREGQGIAPTMWNIRHLLNILSELQPSQLLGVDQDLLGGTLPPFLIQTISVINTVTVFLDCKLMWIKSEQIEVIVFKCYINIRLEKYTMDKSNPLLPAWQQYMSCPLWLFVY